MEAEDLQKNDLSTLKSNSKNLASSSRIHSQVNSYETANLNVMGELQGSLVATKEGINLGGNAEGTTNADLWASAKKFTSIREDISDIQINTDHARNFGELQKASGSNDSRAMLDSVEVPNPSNLERENTIVIGEGSKCLS